MAVTIETKTVPAAAAATATKHDKAASRSASSKAKQDMEKRLRLLDGIVEGGFDDVKRAVAMVSFQTLIRTMRRDVGMRMTGRKELDYDRVYKAYVALTEAPEDKAGLKAMRCDELRCVGRSANLRGFSLVVKAELIAKIVVARKALELFVRSRAGTAEPEESKDDFATEPDDDEEEESAES